MTVVAVFEEVKVYEVTVEYYYNDPKSGDRITFLTKKDQIESRDLPVEIVSPDSTSLGGSDDIYYPKTPVLTITGRAVLGVITIRSAEA